MSHILGKLNMPSMISVLDFIEEINVMISGNTIDASTVNPII